MENSTKLLRLSSPWENRHSLESSNFHDDDEEFYEEIEAPKFVDFTAPDHYCPDDRYWFCDRVGCDQKHSEEMDSEAIFKKFVRRAMAARSPNVARIRKILDASRKCPLSAPAKPSRPRRLSGMGIISTFSKRVEGEEKVVRPLLKPRATPAAKTRPVAAKYLTTPRNKKSTQGESSFRSVRNPKPNNDEELSNGRMVAKALVFHSPEKNAVKGKTSVERHVPVLKLCEGMNKLEVSSGCKVLRRPEESICLDASSDQESKLGKSIESNIRGKSSEPEQQSLKSEESCEDKEQSAAALKVAEEFELKKPTRVENEVAPDSTSALTADSKGEESVNLRSQATNMPDDNSSDGKESIDHSSESKSSGRESDEQLVYNKEDGENKENVAASDVNRMRENNPKQNGRKILAVQEQSGRQVGKKVTQAQDKKPKEGLISPSPVVKLKKPKATNPKPFRLRTDERGILKERRTEQVLPERESATLSTLSRKSQMKQASDIQGLKIPKGQERSKPAAAVAPESKIQPDRKPINVFRESKAMQRLEKFRKISCPRPQGLVPTKIGVTSSLIPGQKLDVINENSPKVVAKSAGKTDDPQGAAAAASQSSSSLVRRPITVAAKPKVQSIHVPRSTASSTKKSKLALQ